MFVVYSIILVIGISENFIFGETYNTSVDEFKYKENEEIKILQKYLQFPTISRESDLGIGFCFQSHIFK